jgi:hypothetical protein
VVLFLCFYFAYLLFPDVEVHDSIGFCFLQ